MKNPADYTDEELIDFYPRIWRAAELASGNFSTVEYCKDIKAELLRRLDLKKASTYNRTFLCKQTLDKQGHIITAKFRFKFTLQEWAAHEGLTYEEVYEPDIAYIYVIEGTVYKELKSTGELIELD